MFCLKDPLDSVPRDSLVHSNNSFPPRFIDAHDQINRKSHSEFPELVGVKIRAAASRDGASRSHTESWRNRSDDVSGTQLCCETRHREPPPPPPLPHGRLVVPTSGAESKLIQVLASRRRMRRGCNASQTHRRSLVYKQSGLFARTERARSTNCIRRNWLERLSFPDAGTLQDREVRRDRLSCAPATRRSVLVLPREE